MRGEHMRRSVERVQKQGSSPHARGTLHILEFDHMAIGIIPACAGNTFSYFWMMSLSRDHPRMRGEHKPSSRSSLNSRGSSPHARGTPALSRAWLQPAGIIPACAGNTHRHQAGAGNLRDHPRMRGEHNQSAQMSTDLTGSSPHARGTQCCRPIVRGEIGIIPACAGNTDTNRHMVRHLGDHPRMRGEH